MSRSGNSARKLQTVTVALFAVVAVAAGWTALLGVTKFEERVSLRAPGWMSKWSGGGEWHAASSEFKLFPKPRWVAVGADWTSPAGEAGFRAREIRMSLNPWQWVTGGPAWQVEVDQPAYTSAFFPVLKSLATRWPLSADGHLALSGGPSELQECDLRFSSVPHQVAAIRIEGLVKGAYQSPQADVAVAGFVQVQGEVAIEGDEVGFEAEIRPQSMQVRWANWLDIPVGTGSKIAVEGRVSEYEFGLDHFRLESGASSFRGFVLIRRQSKVGPPTADASQVVVQAKLQSEVMKLADVAPWIPALRAAGWTVNEGRGDLSVQLDGDAQQLALTTEGSFDGLVAQSGRADGLALKGNGRWRWNAGRWEERQADLLWGQTRITAALTEPEYGGLDLLVTQTLAALDADPTRDEVRVLRAAPVRSLNPRNSKRKK